MATSDKSKARPSVYPGPAKPSPKVARSPAASASRIATIPTYRPSTASMKVWGDILGPLLEVDGVRDLLRLKDRRQVRGLSAAGQILELGSPEGHKLYPAFQFDSRGSLYPEISGVIKIFAGMVETPYTIASWFVSPQDLLDGETPTAWIRAKKDTSQLLAAAQRSAGELNL